MRHRALAIVAVAALGIGALALIPGSARPTVATAEAQSTEVSVASISTPNPELLRRLDNEVAPPPVQAPSPEPVRVAAIAPAPDAASPELAPSSSMLASDPNLKSDSIGASAVNMRSGPTTSSAAISILQPGEAIQVGETSGGWVKVTRADGSTGWVYSTYLASNAGVAATGNQPARVASADTPRAVISGGDGDLQDRTARIASRLPAYARPSNGAPSVFTLQPGDEVYIAEVRGSWLRVETEDGMTAWIRR